MALFAVWVDPQILHVIFGLSMKTIHKLGIPHDFRNFTAPSQWIGISVFESHPPWFLNLLNHFLGELIYSKYL